MRATRTFVDEKGTTRKNGEEWLIKMADTEAHIPGVYEEVVGVISITTLSSRQYCVILDPVGRDGKPQLGQKKLVKGEKSFFLMPGERLEKGTQNVYVMGEDEGLILRATESFKDGDTVSATRDSGALRCMHTRQSMTCAAFNCLCSATRSSLLLEAAAGGSGGTLCSCLLAYSIPGCGPDP